MGELIEQVIGRNLVAVTEARHWHEGQRDGDVESLVHFWLHFQGVPPLMAHGSGELLGLEFSEPYASYDMGEHGETRVGLAQWPDMLGLLPGHRLLDAALIWGYATRPGLGGVLLSFDHCDLALAVDPFYSNSERLFTQRLSIGWSSPHSPSVGDPINRDEPSALPDQRHDEPSQCQVTVPEAAVSMGQRGTPDRQDRQAAFRTRWAARTQAALPPPVEPRR